MRSASLNGTDKKTVALRQEIAKNNALKEEVGKLRKLVSSLMDEKNELQLDIVEQRELIEKFRTRKHKAHRRLKALRELNKHMKFLQVNNSYLNERVSYLQSTNMEHRRELHSLRQLTRKSSIVRFFDWLMFGNLKRT